MDNPPNDPNPASVSRVAPQAVAPKHSSKGIWIFVVVLLVLALAFGVFAFTKREPGFAVETEPVAQRDITEIVVATGKIQPVLQVKISPEVSGEIILLPVKEGQVVKKGDLILKIRPDFYVANTNSAHANYLSSEAGRNLAQANLSKAVAELKRFKSLAASELVSESAFMDVETSHDVARAQFENSLHLTQMAQATLARAVEELAKTTIYAPISGTISRLNSQAGERVVGTATMAGTEVMTIANLEDMEARVDIGEIDIVLIQLGQKATLEVDSFRDRKFTGHVYEVANSAKTSAPGQQQEATKFEVKIRINDKETFLPGMSVSAEIATRSRTNVLTVPIQSVTTRLSPEAKKKAAADASLTEPSSEGPPKKKNDEPEKPLEVVFLDENGTAKMTTVVRGISDDAYVEITSGLKEGQRVVSGSYKAINRELEDGKKITTKRPSATPARPSGT